jgi:hypothetical protein
MPHTINVGGSGNALTYNLGAAQSFSVESLTATLDFTASVLGPTTAWDVIFRDNAGLLIARSRSSNTVDLGLIYTATASPWLPDTQELGNAALDNVVTTGLCATTLPPGSSVTVQIVDPGGVVTGFRMWVEDAGAGIAGLNTDLENIGKSIPNPLLVVVGS